MIVSVYRNINIKTLNQAQNAKIKRKIQIIDKFNFVLISLNIFIILFQETVNIILSRKFIFKRGLYVFKRGLYVFPKLSTTTKNK